MDRSGQTWDRFYVGWMPFYGVGVSWEAAFADLKHCDYHYFMTHRCRPRRKFNTPPFRAKRATLRRRFGVRN
jgi:hypothetical protein